MLHLEDLSWTQLFIASTGAFCLGFSKAGFPGMALINVVIMADLFGAKPSVGLILPLLVLCDLTVYPLFARYATWKETTSLIGVCAVGVIVGYFLLGQLAPEATRRTIGLIILVMLVLQLLRQYKTSLLGNLKGSRWFCWWTGLLMGVATMIANAAGPAYSIYALANQFTKEQFLGIGARCFLVVNLMKAPLMANLAIIDRHSLTIDLALVPALILGVFVGRKVIHHIPQQVFNTLLYLFSFLAGIRLLAF